MYFTKIHVCNVGPHADFETDLTRGAIGIVGRNGVGKSTILALLHASMTGDFSRLSGTKEEAVRDVAGPREESFVEVHWRHGPFAGEIRRNLRGRPVAFMAVCRDSEVGSAIEVFRSQKSEDIQSFLRERIGIDPASWAQYAFKAQEQIDDFFRAPPAQRAKMLHALCGTEDWKKIWEKLGAEEPRLIAEAARYDRLEARRTAQEAWEARQRLRTADRVWEAFGELSVSEEMIVAARRAAQAEARLDGVRAAWAKAQKDHQTCEEIVRSTTAEGKALKAEASHLDELQAQAKAQEKLASEWNAYSLWGTQEIAQRQWIGSLAVKFRPEDRDAIQADLAAANGREARAARIEEDVRKVVLRGEAAVAMRAGVCPTCGAATPEPSPRTRWEASRLPVWDERHGRVKAIRAQARNDGTRLDRRLADFEAQQKSLQTERAKLAKILDRKPSVPAQPMPSGIEADKLRQELAKVSAAAARLEEVRRTYKANHSRLGAAATDAARLQEEVTALDAQVASVPDYADVLARGDRERQAKAAAQRDRHHAQTVRTDAQARLKRFQASRAGARRAQSCLDDLRRARQVFHADGLPRQVARQRLRQLTTEMNRQLAGFSNPFVVAINSEAEFVVRGGGLAHPKSPQALSVGQRTILAIAFWSAIASLAGLSVQALDEPTAHLDEANRDVLAEELRRMADRIRGHRQVFFVTHADNLRSAFDQVIDLGNR